MKFTINTEKMKYLVSRVSKGVGNNKLIPLTSLMLIRLVDNELTLVTTDATNYLYIVEDGVEGEDFYAVVDANVFSKLVGKITSENIIFNLKPDVQILEVKGNGNYKIELPLDENGQLIKYPDPVESVNFNDDGVTSFDLKKSVLSVILETIKPALAVTLDEPCYTGYYVGNNVVATDTYKIASMDVKLFDKPYLVSSEFLDLVDAISDEKITAFISDNTVVFTTTSCTIYGKLMEGLEDFAIDAINELINTEFTSFCSIHKADLLQILDRLSLFVKPYDKNGIVLTFTDKGLSISSKSSSGVETVEYVNSDNFVPYTCEIDIEMLMQEVKAISSDKIDLYYGEDMAIKMVDGNISIIVALLEDSE